ncbi:LppU/SCO3897 family protein [Streptomyces sp. SD31]|uniref:LppU/SCO3897 family protein n=1 Tax=Streptomyces sp. SD31 TaxID=3452208 RepID=UPI003F8964BE
MTTPPPQGNPYAQGQNPYAQAQQPYGQPQGQAPYPPQGGYPQQPGQPGFPQQGAAPYAPVPPQQPGRRFSFKTIKNILAVAAVSIMIIVGYIMSQDDAKNAAEGDCLKAPSSSVSDDTLEVVDCSSSEAEVKVLKKIKGHYTSLTAQTECSKVEGSTSLYTETMKTGTSDDEFLLCLKDL